MTNATPPRWDLSNVYPNLDSEDFNTALGNLSTQLDRLDSFFNNKISTSSISTPITELAALADELINRFNDCNELGETIGVFIYSFISTDSFDQLAKKTLSQFEQTEVRLQMLRIQA